MPLLNPDPILVMLKAMVAECIKPPMNYYGNRHRSFNWYNANLTVTFDKSNQYRIRRNSQRLFEHIQLSGSDTVLYVQITARVIDKEKFKQTAGVLVVCWVSIENLDCY